MLYLAIFLNHALAMKSDEAWHSYSDPTILSQNFETRFFLLPKAGQLNSLTNYWSGDYWPLKLGMIDYRWKDRNHKLPAHLDFSKIAALSIEELNLLSPAEKLDLLNADSIFSIKNQIRSQIPYSPKSWEGLCDGWASASIHHQEPSAKILTNSQGVKIPFDSSDIKALLSYYYSQFVDHKGFIGKRCENSFPRNNSNCTQDLNAGAFHIIISNFIGLDQRAIVADLKRFNQVWNHPIVGYESKIIQEIPGQKSDSAPGTFRRVKLKSKIYYIAESINHSQPVLGTSLQNEKSITFTYTLDLDQYGLIIGGEWESFDRPDFLWVPGKVEIFEGKFYRLNELIE
jgi:hypothetical protein